MPEITIESSTHSIRMNRFPEAQDDDQGMARGLDRSSYRTKAGSLLRQSLPQSFSFLPNRHHDGGTTTDAMQ